MLLHGGNLHYVDYVLAWFGSFGKMIIALLD